MDAKEYLTERKRMCKTVAPKECHYCDFYASGECDRALIESSYPDQAIDTVSEWSEAHPRKTYKDDFLEKFPNAKLEDDGQTPISYVEEIFGMYID